MQHVFATQRFCILILLLVASTLSLTGCGNKGPLYLPPEPVQEVVSVSNEPVETPESEETTNTENPETTTPE